MSIQILQTLEKRSFPKLSFGVVARRCARAITKTAGCREVRCPCGALLCYVCGDLYCARVRNEQFTTGRVNGLLQKHAACVWTSASRDKAAIKELYDRSNARDRERIQELHREVASYDSTWHRFIDAATQTSIFLCEPIHFFSLMAVFTSILAGVVALDMPVHGSCCVVLATCLALALASVIMTL